MALHTAWLQNHLNMKRLYYHCPCPGYWPACRTSPPGNPAAGPTLHSSRTGGRRHSNTTWRSSCCSVLQPHKVGITIVFSFAAHPQYFFAVVSDNWPDGRRTLAVSHHATVARHRLHRADDLVIVGLVSWGLQLFWLLQTNPILLICVKVVFVPACCVAGGGRPQSGDAGIAATPDQLQLTIKCGDKLFHSGTGQPAASKETLGRNIVRLRRCPGTGYLLCEDFHTLAWRDYWTGPVVPVADSFTLIYHSPIHHTSIARSSPYLIYGKW